MRLSCCASSKGMLVVARARALFLANDTALALVRILFFLFLGIIVPVAGLQAKGNLRYLLV